MVFAIGGATEPSHTASTGVGEALQMPPRRLQLAPVWRALKDAPIAHQFAGTTVAGGKMWIAGGLTQDSATTAVYGYDPVIDSWTRGPDLPMALHHVAAVTYHDEVVLIGGWAPANGNLSGLVSGKVFALRRGRGSSCHRSTTRGWPKARPSSATRSSWWAGRPTTSSSRRRRCSTARAGPTPRRSPLRGSACPRRRDGTYVYAVGGRNLSSDKNSAAFERFDPATGAWQTMPNMPTPRGGVAATCIDGRIVAAGGEEPTAAAHRRGVRHRHRHLVDAARPAGGAARHGARHGGELDLRGRGRPAPDPRPIRRDGRGVGLLVTGRPTSLTRWGAADGNG